MTGYTVNTGSTKEFANGWDRIFAGGKQTAKKAAAAGKKAVSKSAVKAKAGKKKPARKRR